MPKYRFLIERVMTDKEREYHHNAKRIVESSNWRKQMAARKKAKALKELLDLCKDNDNDNDG